MDQDLDLQQQHSFRSKVGADSMMQCCLYECVPVCSSSWLLKALCAVMYAETLLLDGSEQEQLCELVCLLLHAQFCEERD